MTIRVFRGHKTFSLVRPFLSLINSINHQLAARNSIKFPQLAIFAFDHIGLKINMEGRYERDSLDILRKFLVSQNLIETSDFAIDIGANIGNHSVFFAEFFSRVYSFEPNPKTFKLLEFNCNGKNIILINYGLSDICGRLRFAVSSTNIGGSRVILEDGPVSGEIIHIDVHRLDDIEEIPQTKIALIKIDVEGHELHVIRGAKKIIQNNKPAIVFELHPHEIKDGTSSVIDELKNEGYKFYTIQNRFYFGEKLPGRILSMVLRLIFGFQKEILETHVFRKRFYDMVVALHQ